MRADCVLDTNVLLYAVSNDPADAAKHEVARELMAAADWGASAQVLQEFYVSAGRLRYPLSAAFAAEFVAGLRVRPIVAIDFDLVIRAIGLSQRYQISYWDAAVVAAAHELHSPILYTEDLNHEQFYGDVQAINPFVSLAR